MSTTSIGRLLCVLAILGLAGCAAVDERSRSHSLDRVIRYYEQALRWSQVRGLGGAPPLAAAVAASRLGRDFEKLPHRVRAVISSQPTDLALQPVVRKHLLHETYHVVM